MRRLLPVALALLAALLVPRLAPAQVSDEVLYEQVADAIRGYARYSIFDSIEVGVENRVVTLAGRVTAPDKREDIERRVQRIDGIRSLNNEIGVLPVSRSDDALRYRIARAIYSHTMFWAYAQMPVPPIHIIVERGHITLTGAADTEVQRVLAASLAQVGGSFGVTNRIQIVK